MNCAITKYTPTPITTTLYGTGWIAPYHTPGTQSNLNSIQKIMKNGGSPVSESANTKLGKQFKMQAFQYILNAGEETESRIALNHKKQGRY